MQHIIKEVKATTKKYNTKDGKKESISKRVDLGVDAPFGVGEYVAIITASDFEKLTDETAAATGDLEKTIADKDATIDNLNGSVAKFKADVKAKTDKIADLSKEIKALKTKVAELESDISAKDETIETLNADVTGKDAELVTSGNVIDGLNDDVATLNAKLEKSKSLLLSKDDAIAKLDKQIAIYDAIDVDKLMEKADELDKTKNVIILQQKQITEYIQLVNYHKETATAYKNQGLINKALGRDAAAKIITPTLYLIDSSGNPIADDDADKGNDNGNGKGNDSGKPTSPDEN